MIRAKTKRRLVILLVGFVFLLGASAAVWAWRQKELDGEALAARKAGMEAWAAGDYRGALAGLGLYLSRFDPDPETLYPYAIARRHVELPEGKHLASAIGLLRKVVDAEPDHLKARRELLDLFGMVGFDVEAVKQADAILERRPGDGFALRKKAESLLRLRRKDEALACVGQLRKARPKSAWATMMAATLLVEKAPGREEARAAVKKLLEDVPEGAQRDLVNGHVHVLYDEIEPAREAFLRAAQNAPSDPEFLGILVHRMDAVGLFEESLGLLRQSPDLKDPELRRTLVRRLWATGRPEETLDRLQAVKVGDDDAGAELLAYRCLAFRSAGREEDAKAALEALRARAETDAARAWIVYLTEVEPKLDAPDRAVLESCFEARGLDPENPLVHDAIGRIWLGLGERELAATSFARAAELMPFWPRPLLELARMDVSSDKVRRAWYSAHRATQVARSDAAAVITRVMVEAARVRDANGAGAAALLPAVEQLHRALPSVSRLGVLETELLVFSGRDGEAKERLRATLDADPPLDAKGFVRLVRISVAGSLGLEELVLDRADRVCGPTPDLVLERALLLHRRDETAKGRRLLETRARREETVDWRLALARFLDRTEDPSATAEWAKLADAAPDDLSVQRAVLESHAAWRDRELLDRAIGRTRNLTGETALAWRLARARWLLESPRGPEEAASRAATLLSEVIRVVPTSVAARGLMAHALEKLGDTRRAAEHLGIAAGAAPAASPVNLQLARILARQGDRERARTYLDAFVKAPRAPADLLLIAARELADLGDTEAATRALERLPEGRVPLFLARLSLKSGHLDRAEALVRRALPDGEREAVVLLAGIEEMQGRKEEAENVLGMLDDLDLPPAEKERAIADFHRGAGRTGEAIDHYRAAWTADPEDESAVRSLLALLVRDQRIEEAGATLAAARGRGLLEGLDGALPALRRAVAHAALRDLAEETVKRPRALLPVLKKVVLTAEEDAPSAKHLKELLTLAPRSLPVRIATVRLLDEKGFPAAAAAAATAAMDDFPADPLPARLAAGLLADQGRFDEVRSAAEEWRRRSPAQARRADVMLAVAEIGAGDPEEAAGTLRPWVEEAKADPESNHRLLLTYARALVLRGRTEVARDLLRPCLALSAEWRLDYLMLGAHDVRPPAAAKEWLEAAEPFCRQASDTVALAEAWQRLGERAGDVDFGPERRAALEAAVTAPDLDAEDWAVVGSMSHDAGDLDGSERAYRRALREGDARPEVKNNLAMVLLEKGDLDEALRLAEEAVEAAPNPWFLDTLARVHAARGEGQKAVAAARRAADSPDAGPWFRLRLGRALAAAGQAEEALSVLREVESSYPSGAGLDPAAFREMQRLRDGLGQ